MSDRPTSCMGGCEQRVNYHSLQPHTLCHNAGSSRDYISRPINGHEYKQCLVPSPTTPRRLLKLLVCAIHEETRDQAQ
jgi:hypothetical protein